MPAPPHPAHQWPLFTLRILGYCGHGSLLGEISGITESMPVEEKPSPDDIERAPGTEHAHSPKGGGSKTPSDGQPRVQDGEPKRVVRIPQLSSRDILQGVVIGITVALILGFYDLGKQLIERNTQIRYIREIIVEGMDLVACAQDATIVESGESRTVPAHRIRHAYFKDMQDKVESALNGLAVHVQYGKKRELLESLGIVDRIVDAFRGGIPTDPTTYDIPFDQIRAMRWLGLDTHEANCNAAG